MIAKYSTLVAAALVAGGMLAGCSEHKARPSQAQQTATAEPAHASSGAAPMSPAAAGGAGPWQHLAKMDTRQPVPLLPMMANHQKAEMRDHLEAVQQIVAALGKQDYDGVAKAAKRIGTSPQMKMMCTHMGAGAPGFTDQGMAFHKTADTIVAAAKTHDQAKVMQALSATMATCTACHARYKQQVVSQKVWEQKTGMSAPGPAMHQKMQHQMHQ